MFDQNTYITRRKALTSKVGSGLILLLGNDESGMNYKDNTYAFRQDSSFLYFFGLDRPGLAALIDIDEGKEIIFGDELTIDDVIWMGTLPSIASQAASVGIKQILPMSDLESTIKKATTAKRTVHYLPPYRPENAIKIHHLLGTEISKVKASASVSLTKAVIDLRSKKTDAEIKYMEDALVITKRMHLAVMKGAKEGLKESDLTAMAQEISTAADVLLAYPIILTVHGQTLHNHHHANTLKTGQLVLGDFGAENPAHYASDITRTFPVAKTFTSQQKDIYETVLRAQQAVIDMLKPGVSYKDAHLQSARVITEGLKAVGLMKGDTDAAVAAGAHALFFPHGLGHMIGLDVHDMEDLGEDHVGYAEGTKRSDQFGLRYLRMARNLEEGFVLTVEPGIYFIPELIDRWQAEKNCADFINYDKLSGYRSFGGIRIEDDCLITSTGARVLGDPIPKTISDIEAIRA